MDNSCLDKTKSAKKQIDKFEGHCWLICIRISRRKKNEPTKPFATYIVQFQKISILPPQKGLEFPRGRGVL